MQEPIYMLLAGASRFAGGVTRNVLHRARLTSERIGQTVTVLTLRHDPKFHDEVKLMREVGLLGPLVEIRNFVDELDPTSKASQGRSESTAATSGDAPPNPARIRTWVYCDGPALTVRTPDSTVASPTLDLPAPGSIRRVDAFDSAGRCRRIEFFRESAKKACQSLHLDQDGRCFLALNFDDDEHGKSIGAYRFAPDGQLKAAYASVRDLQAEWASGVAAQHEKAVFFSDWRHSDAVLTRMTHPGVARIKTFHINHLAEPRTYGSPLQPRTRIELGRLNSFDAFVSLSTAQLADIARQFGPRSTYHVVPNAAPPANLQETVERDPWLVVGIGRYHAFKRWDRAIEAFAKVVERVPQARLELWGFGPEESSYHAQIRELGLEESVFVRGITHDSQKVLAGAALSVLTSPAEAFGLVTLESMTVGTPMVAFEVTYGLGDMIDSGVNSVFVPHPDTDALAEAIVDLLKHPHKREAMGRKALHTSRRFSEDVWIDRWLAVIEAACEQRQHRRTIDVATASLASLTRSRSRALVDTRVHVEGPPAEEVRLTLYAKARDPFFDTYGIPAPVRTTGTERVPATSNDLPYAGLLPLGELRAEKATWDLYVSCSARNAHRFVRLSATAESRMKPWRAHGADYRPYVTENGYVSIRVSAATPKPSPPARATRWVRRRLSRNNGT